MRNIFEDFLASMPVSKDIIMKYKDKIPSELMNIWKQYGFGSFMSGYLRIINPDEYRDVLDETYARAAIALPVLSTAMGDIIVWEENRYLRIIQYRYGIFTGISAGFDFFWEDVANGELNSLFDIKTYICASNRLGIPNCDECFGYVPLLGIGGGETIENLQKVDMKTHLQIITQFMGKVGECE